MIRRVSVRNFRCLRQVELDCSNLTALIGPNGSGKSALLHALRFFFGDLAIDEADTWGDDPDLTVEVALVLEIGQDEDALSPFLNDGTIWVARRSSSQDGNRQVFYVARRRGNPDFAEIRAQTKATPAKALYEALDPEKYQDLPAWSNFQNLSTALEAWEQDHPDELEWFEDRSVGFGSGTIDLARYLDPVFLPAVSDAAAESEDARTSVLRTLIDRIVNPGTLFEESAIQLDSQLRDGYEAMIDGSGQVLSDAAQTISARLSRFAPGTAVELEWEGRPPSVTTPGVRARLVEGGHAAEIGRQGHGVQRAYILALLYELADGAPTTGDSSPRLVMMIEEPELYQHPTRARLLARVLGELTSGEGPQTQVIYATHSPHFVGLDRLESLRVLRLESGETHPSTKINTVDLTDIATRLWTAGGEEGDPYTAETLLPRLRLLGQVPVADGFFADGVVLVEGEEDRAFLLAAALEAGFDFDMLNLAVLPVGGKTNLDRPILVFRALGIPVYTLFDGDANVPVQNRAENQRTNRRLLNVLASEPVDSPETQVNADWACFQENLERTVRGEVGSQLWGDSLRAAADEAGFVDSKDAKKNPTVLLDAYRRARQDDGGSPTLDSAIEAIRTKFVAV